MLSESLRATMAAESRFRIDAPNSMPRSIMVVALEDASARILSGIAREKFRNAAFRASVWPERTLTGSIRTLEQWSDLVAGHARDLVDEIARSDLVVMVALAGMPVTGASIIGEVCASRFVKTSSIIIPGADTGSADLSYTLRELRPWSRTLGVIGSADMIEDMLRALGA